MDHSSDFTDEKLKSLPSDSQRVGYLNLIPPPLPLRDPPSSCSHPARMLSGQVEPRSEKNTVSEGQVDLSLNLV